MVRVLIVLVPVALIIWGLLDCALASRPAVRALPKLLWLLVILLPVLGVLLWVAFGRPRGTDGGPGGSGRGGRRPASPLPPDDDPDFLRKLDEERWLRQRRQERGGGDKPEG